MEKALKFIAGILPIVFAFAFVVPVIDQGLQAFGVTAPLGLTTLTLALVLGGTWGLIAQFTGRWI